MRRPCTPTPATIAAISGATALILGVQISLTYLCERRAARRHQDLIHADLDLSDMDPEVSAAVRRIHLRLVQGGSAGC